MKRLTIDLPNHVSLIDRAYIIARGATSELTGGVTLCDLAHMLKVPAAKLWPLIWQDDRFFKPEQHRHA